MTGSTPGSFSRVLLTVTLLCGSAVTASAQVSVPSNYPSIQAAINAVASGALPDGTTINVQRGVYAEALVVANTPRSFTVRGVGGPDVTVVDAAGRGAAAVTVYRATGRITFAGLTFRNGAPPVSAGGGFVITESSPTFVDVVFEANRASFGGGGTLITSNAVFTSCVIRNNIAERSGGGVYMVAGSRPVFTGTDIVGNRAGAGPAGVGDSGVGGGVDARDSSPTFRGSRISSNTSVFAGGGIYHGGEFGSPFGVATLVLSDSEASGNVTSPFSASANPAEGGGIHIEDNAVAQLTRVHVVGNRANTSGGLSAYRARFDLVDSVVADNHATGRSDGGIGGGIGASSTHTGGTVRPSSIVVMTRTLVRGNVSLTGGGIVVTGDVGRPGTLSIADSVVDNNRAQNQGGGMLVSNANLSNTLVLRNVVSGGGTPFGGGIAVITASSATISNTTIAGNTAASHGGGVFMSSTGSLTMNSSRVVNNVSSTAFGGGGIFVGPSSPGSVTGSLIGDNTPIQIVEHGNPCPTVTYSNNTMVAVPQNPAYQACGGETISGTTSTFPRFAHVVAAPQYGTRFSLAWAFGRATSVTVGGVGTFNGSAGGVDVAPGGSAGYSISAAASSANGGNYGSTGASVGFVTPPVAPRGRAITTAGDFDGDGRADLSVYRPSNGTWFHRFWSGATFTAPYGLNSDVIAPADFDGDGRADQTVFRPSTGTWYFRYSNSGATGGLQWGLPNDVPVPADYDGDGLGDPTVFRPSNGTWYIRTANGAQHVYQWGLRDDIPAPGDYDGDGLADLAVFRPASGVWYIRHSTTGALSTRQWGLPGDIPVPGDYDGDGKTDTAVFRPSNGVWYIVHSSTGATPAYQWALSNDRPVPGDFDGDGKTDLAVFRPSNASWYVVNSSTGGGVTVQWGLLNDVPILKRP